MDAEITIIIPVYNRAATVEPTLASVQAQTWRPLRVILVDNNSSDTTFKVLSDWKNRVEGPDFKVDITNEPRPGASCARNAGLAAVTSAWTMFFDSDDIMKPSHVASAMACAKDNPDAGIIAWNQVLNFPDGSRRILRFPKSDFIFRNIFNASFNTLSYMAKTELFRNAGGWRENMLMAEDMDLGNRLLMLSPHIKVINTPPTVEIQPSPDAISAKSRHSISNYTAALEAIRETLPPKSQHWIDLQYLVLCSTHCRGEEDFAREILAKTKWPRRWLWRLLYNYSLAGGRGVGRIYQLLRWTGL